jgi:hypothetical protein
MKIFKVTPILNFIEICPAHFEMYEMCPYDLYIPPLCAKKHQTLVYLKYEPSERLAKPP